MFPGSIHFFSCSIKCVSVSNSQSVSPSLYDRSRNLRLSCARAPITQVASLRFSSAITHMCPSPLHSHSLEIGGPSPRSATDDPRVHAGRHVDVRGQWHIWWCGFLLSRDANGDALNTLAKLHHFLIIAALALTCRWRGVGRRPVSWSCGGRACQPWRPPWSSGSSGTRRGSWRRGRG